MFIGSIITSGYQDLEGPVLGNLSHSNLVRGSVDISCTATDNSMVKEFKIYIDAVYFETVVGEVLDNHTVFGIPGGSNIDIFVTAVDIHNNESLASNILNIDTITDNIPITGTLSTGGISNLSLDLVCTATDDFGVVSFDVYQDDVFIENVPGSSLSYKVTGLTPVTSYDFKVQAIDDGGQKGTFSNTLNVTTTLEPVIGLGLSDALITVPAQNNATWTLRSFDASEYIGKTVRLVVMHYQAGNDWAADIQIDDMNVGGNVFDPEVGVYSFETTTGHYTGEYVDAIFSPLADGTVSGSWNRDASGTGSSGTGNTAGNTGSYYYYTEMSSPSAGRKFWLRSGGVVMSDGTLELYTAQFGPTCGEITVYLDVIS